MTSEQFDAMAQLMRLRKSASREALRLVLVGGLTHDGAANIAGAIRTDVTRQVGRAKKIVELAKTVAKNQFQITP